MEQSIKNQVCVSIIIPVYNLQNCLEDCIESVIRQTYRSLQIIIVDDGSTDHSLEICQRYASKDSRILVEHQDNSGVSSARNRGLKKATGEYVLFIDGDDTVDPDFVEAYISHATATKADIIIGGLTKIEQGGKSIIVPSVGTYSNKDFFSLLCREGTLVYGYVCCKLYCLFLIKDNAIIFNEKMKSQEDLDFALSVYEKAQTISCIDNSGYYYQFVPTARKASAEPILGNQIKLFQIAESVGAETKVMLPRFQSMLYTWLYHANSVQRIKDIMLIDIPDALLNVVKGQRREVQRIIKEFKSKKAHSIYRYFLVRKSIREVLVKLHISKPIQ